jgi:hypothetical protein
MLYTTYSAPAASTIKQKRSPSGGLFCFKRL